MLTSQTVLKCTVLYSADSHPTGLVKNCSLKNRGFTII